MLLAISLFFVAWLVFQQKSIVQSIYASIIPIALIIELILFIDRNNRQIRNYFEAIEWDDLSIKMPEDMHDKSFHDLNVSLNLFNTKLEHLRRDNFAQFYFIEALIKEALVGLVVIDQDNKVFFVNKSFEQIIGKSKIYLFKPAKQELETIWDQISDLKINEKRTIEINLKEQSRIILFQISEFIINKEKYRLFSAQNIKSEMESTEIEAWKKLIRILSHEILNSTSPILSLSSTLSDLIHDDEHEIELLIQKLKEGLDVINQRSSGLIKFTNAFSTISKLPEPEKTKIITEELIQKIQILFQKQFDENKIEFKYSILPKAEELFADQYQIEQVLINLIKNSIEAFNRNSNNRNINIKALYQSEFIRIEITDNGDGISTDKMDKIFLPFFTTKEKGNGIGLALSKQILNLHKGNISIESITHNGTKIILEIPSN